MTRRIDLPRWGLGTAPVGKNRDPIAAVGTVAAAWNEGVRLFDTAPKYGDGAAERRSGVLLSQKPREEFLLATKVGTQADGQDFSRDAVRTSLDRSLERLRLDRVDLVAIHDPDLYMDQAIDECFGALAQLRSDGVVGAVGVGMNDAALAARFVRATDLDYVLIAGRYSLLDQAAAEDLLPLCLERGVSVIVGGVFNSGILANPVEGSSFDYRPAAPEVLTRARMLRSVCAAFDVSLPAAALHFPFAHPAVAAVVVGADGPEQARQNADLARTVPPAELWPALVDAGLVRAP